MPRQNAQWLQRVRTIEGARLEEARRASRETFFVVLLLATILTAYYITQNYNLNLPW